MRLTGVTLEYPGRPSPALKHVSFDWSEAESLWIVGPSGSGKSSLAMVLKGLIAPTSGTIGVIENGSQIPLKAIDLLSLIGWVDAQPERQIFASTVAEEVGFGLQIRGVSGEELKKGIEGALNMVGMEPDRFLDRDPLTLSGGEKRRLAIASTLAVKTPFYIFDEPGAGLDEAGLKTVRGILAELRRIGAGTMVITHDLIEGEFGGSVNSGKLMVMQKGSIIYSGSLEEIDFDKLNRWLATKQGEPQ